MPWMPWADQNPIAFWLIAITLVLSAMTLAAWWLERDHDRS